MKIRNLLAGSLASVLGLSMPQFAQAQTPEDTGIYADMSRAEINQELRQRTVYVNDKNFDREVLKYDGAVIILADSSCPAGENYANISTNMQRVYLGLIDKFDDAKVNRLDLKFAFFDGCKYNGDGAQTAKALQMVSAPNTYMYLDGKLIDTKTGGPTSDKGIEVSVQNMSTWINYDLLGIKDVGDENLVVLYKGGSQLKPYPSSELVR